MKKITVFLLLIFITNLTFSQSQSPITTTHFLSDFQTFNVADDDDNLLRFHNISDHNSPITFSATSIDDAIVNIMTTPLSNVVSNNIGSNIYLSEIFGHINIETLNKNYNVITFLMNGISIDNLVSDISIIRYDEHYYIFVNNGKISINIGNDKFYFLAGQSFVINENKTWSLLPNGANVLIYKNKSISNVMSNKQAKLSQTKSKMEAHASPNSLGFYRLYIYYYFLTHY